MLGEQAFTFPPRCPPLSQQVSALHLVGLEDSFTTVCDFLKRIYIYYIYMYMYLRGPFTNFLNFIFYNFIFIYFWLWWSSLLHGLFSGRTGGLLSRCGARALGAQTGCGVQASLVVAPRPRAQAQELRLTGLVALRHVVSEFLDRTRVFSISSSILYFTTESPGRPSYLILKNVINLKMS